MRFHRIVLAATAFAAPLLVTPAASAQIATSNVVFPRGSTSTVVRTTLVGSQIRDYYVRASAGQTLRVNKTGSPIIFFNILPPGSNDAGIFTGSTEGNHFAGTLSQSGVYKIRVYQMRATARRGQRGTAVLSIAVTGRPGMARSGRPGMGATGSGISGLRGMNSIDAIDVMTRRGFANVDDVRSGNTQYGIFYNRQLRMCAQMTMADGKVVSVDDIHSHPKCR